MFTRAKHLVDITVSLAIDTDRKILPEDVIDEMTLTCACNTVGGVIRNYKITDIKVLNTESMEVTRVRNSKLQRLVRDPASKDGDIELPF